MNTGPGDRRHAQFETTAWSVVVRAGGDDTSASRQALEHLCAAYWYPLYAYARSRGAKAARAEDLTQAFFVKLLESDGVARADPNRGRFRSFLLVSFRNFMRDEHKRDAAQMRGGGRTQIPFDVGSAEKRFLLEPVDELTPERAFDLRWARAVLEHALARLRDDFTARGKPRVFEAIRPFLQGGSDIESQADAATRVGMNAGAFRIALHRARQAYGTHVREEALRTLAAADDVEDEIDRLMDALRP